jgi:hypothetical protein
MPKGRDRLKRAEYPYSRASPRVSKKRSLTGQTRLVPIPSPETPLEYAETQSLLPVPILTGMTVSGRSQVKIWDTRSYGHIGVPQGADVLSEMTTDCEGRSAYIYTSSTVQSTKRPPVCFEILVSENGTR